MPVNKRLAYIEIEASDLAAWRSFAESILCAEALDGPSADTLWLRFDERPFRIALRHGPLDDLRSIGLEVDDREAFAAAREELTKAGLAPVAGSPQASRARAVAELMTVTDPAGLEVELSYGAITRPQAPFRPPRPHSGFVTGSQGLGHVLLSVPDPGSVEAFYEKALGFRVSDYGRLGRDGETRFVFLRCNSRHHTLAVGALPMRKRLVHFMLQCRQIDDVGRALDRVPGSGLRQTRALGRHVNDKMLSFYMETPSGVQVEYGWGGLEVEEQDWAVMSYDATSVWGHQAL
jgi:2,3-dihydroxybiphenyl 1,2-dioxygenase